MDLKRYLLIFNERILDSSVVDGTPSFVAAPEGPETRPRLSARAASIIFFSRSGDILNSVLDDGAALADCRDNQLTSIDRTSPSDTITARSMTFCNSRILPGHE